jgi:uncharacterized membrane protein YuzA (DUF378 family)
MGSARRTRNTNQATVFGRADISTLAPAVLGHCAKLPMRGFSFVGSRRGYFPSHSFGSLRRPVRCEIDRAAPFSLKYRLHEGTKLDSTIIVGLVVCWVLISIAATTRYHGVSLGWIDIPTLLIVILAALNIGFKAFFGIDLAARMLSPQFYNLVSVLVGMSGVWQFFRQRLR